MNFRTHLARYAPKDYAIFWYSCVQIFYPRTTKPQSNSAGRRFWETMKHSGIEPGAHCTQKVHLDSLMVNAVRREFCTKVFDRMVPDVKEHHVSNIVYIGITRMDSKAVMYIQYWQVSSDTQNSVPGAATSKKMIQ